MSAFAGRYVLFHNWFKLQAVCYVSFTFDLKSFLSDIQIIETRNAQKIDTVLDFDSYKETIEHFFR